MHTCLCFKNDADFPEVFNSKMLAKEGRFTFEEYDALKVFGVRVFSWEIKRIVAVKLTVGTGILSKWASGSSSWYGACNVPSSALERSFSVALRR